MAVRIVTDSICHPSKERAEEMGIEMVPINIHFGEEVLRDQVDIDSETFYNRLAASKELPTTSAPSIDRFTEAFRTILDRGEDVFLITVTGDLSNTYQVALKAKASFDEKDAGRIVVFDSQAAGASASLLAVEGAEMAKAGATLKDIETALEALRPFVKLVVMFDTLKYIEKSGKVGKVAAIAGNLFRVKPLIQLHQGKPEFFGRARGRHQAVKMILEQFKKDTAGADKVRVALTHANAEKDIAPFREEISAMFPDVEMDLVPFATSMGAHAGPGIIGVCYMYAKA